MTWRHRPPRLCGFTLSHCPACMQLLFFMYVLSLVSFSREQFVFDTLHCVYLAISRDYKSVLPLRQGGFVRGVLVPLPPDDPVIVFQTIPPAGTANIAYYCFVRVTAAAYLGLQSPSYPKHLHRWHRSLSTRRWLQATGGQPGPGWSD